ncbi:hypothetical protein Tsp_10284, partial [Trichinella spiralis]
SVRNIQVMCIPAETALFSHKYI